MSSDFDQLIDTLGEQLDNRLDEMFIDFSTIRDDYHEPSDDELLDAERLH